MTRRILAIVGGVVFCLYGPSPVGLAQRTGLDTSVGAAAGADLLSPDSQRAVITQYCQGCHNDQLKSGGISVQALKLPDVAESAALAEKMIRKLRAGMMPPAGARRPDEATIRALTNSLETSLDKAAAARPNPGSRTFQRLNRGEYARSVRDLLGIDVDVTALLPPDTLSAGFDNIADSQSFSPAVMEGYMRAAAKIVNDALGDSSASPTSVTYNVPSTVSQMRHVDGAPMGTRGGISVVHNIQADGDYVFTIRLQAATNGGLIGRRSLNEQIEVSIDGEQVALLDIDPRMSESAGKGLNVQTDRIPVNAGSHRVSAAFMQKFSGLVDDLVAPIEFTLADAIGAAQLLQLPHLQDLNITGPFDVTGVSETASRRKVFTCRPSKPEQEIPCATGIITNLARQAYRRPLTSTDVEGLLGFYRAGRKAGDFETGIRTALQAILASPHFVFRLEQRPPNVAAGQNYRISDLELASRLSYFLWSTAPDDELVGLAARRKLRNPVELERQVWRMLQDRRSESLATRFATGWLHLAELESMTPDALLYPLYDRTLAQALRRETELLFDSIVREDRSVLELLNADYTFVNERLALHYKIPGILGSRFRRVEMTSEARRGLLGHGSILTMTSNADRTSPVRRGKWVMEVLLGTPPPPPPPTVPELERTSAIKDGQLLSVRERMEAHRANPACSSCHRLIDPIGLALENFDVTGVWRIKDNGVPVDPTTVLYDGTPLNGPASLRQAILKYSDAFIGNLTENLLTYALGRRVEYYDMPAVRAITRGAAREGYRFSSFVLGIVNSVPFQMTRAEEAMVRQE
jgi:cytochrome c553